MQIEEVILVNTSDEEIGTMEKMKAHEEALLHRALSVFVFNQKGEMLIHKRAIEKYHSGGLWTNACCSHPRKGETSEEAAHRRLMEEMGFDCPVSERFSFIYKVKLDQGLTEYELDHVFFGFFDGRPQPNPDEVCDWKYISICELKDNIKMEPEAYTEWFKIAIDKMNKNKIALKP